MSKPSNRLDPDQMNLFDARIEQYRDLKEEILKGEPPKPIESFEEACIGIAASWKRAIRESGLSREQVVDRINEFFGWGNGSKKALSIHMFNHYLSKPIQYPPPAYLVFPIQHITGSLEPTKAFAEPEDAKVISGDEVRQMALGKLDETILEMQRLKKELRGKK